MSTLNLIGDHQLCTGDKCVVLNILERENCPAKKNCCEKCDTSEISEWVKCSRKDCECHLPTPST